MGQLKKLIKVMFIKYFLASFIVMIHKFPKKWWRMHKFPYYIEGCMNSQRSDGGCPNSHNILKDAWIPKEVMKDAQIPILYWRMHEFPKKWWRMHEIPYIEECMKSQKSDRQCSVVNS